MAWPKTTKKEHETASRTLSDQLPVPIRKKALETAPVSSVAAGTSITGDITSGGIVEIYGGFEGKVRASRVLIAENGKLNGKIDAEHVEVAGGLEGDISADHISLLQTARVTGNIKYQTLTIETGAILDGKCESKAPVAEPKPGSTAADPNWAARITS